MKASLQALALGLFLLMPFAVAHAQGPSLSPIANVSVNAGGTLNVNVVAVDAENRAITLTGALPPFATLNTPTFGVGVVVTTLTLTPTATHEGDYSAAVTAAAGGVSSVRVFQITVNPAGSNQAPRVESPPYLEATSGSSLTFQVNVSDPDSDPIASLNAVNLPVGATFTPNSSNLTGQFNWTPGPKDAGDYDVEFMAENALWGTAVTHIRVTRAPGLSITPIDDVTVETGGFLSVPVDATGLPGELIQLTAALPAFATLEPPGSGIGSVSTTVTLTPPAGSAGTYHASITATSQGTSVTEVFDIIVTGTGGGDNRAPVLTAPPTATVLIGSALSFAVTASDPDGDHVDLFGSALPPGSSFTDNADNTGTFTWSPVAGQAGVYTASFTGLDNRGGSGSASTIITVMGVGSSNNAPTLSAPLTRQVDEGVSLSFGVTASDPDGDHVTLSANSLPTGATFSDNGNNTGTFSWTPGSTQSGTYQVAFLGDDGNGGTGTASTIITVMDTHGDGEVPGQACLIGRFKPHRETTCFRIRPVNHSFDLQDVVLTSIRIRFQGELLAALDGARIDFACPHGNGRGRQGAPYHGDGDDDDDDDDDDGDRDDDHGGGKGHCVSCRQHERDKEHRDRGEVCDTLGIRACFSTDALIDLFTRTTMPAPRTSSGGHHGLPCDLLDAQILATLTNGATVVATFQRHDDDGGDDDDDDRDGDDERANGRGAKSGHDNALNARTWPNPLNPTTELSFTTRRDGRVRVVVLDMQGRVVKRLLDDYRTAGSQALAWDGKDQSNARVAHGVYFLRIVTSEGSATRRVTVLH